MTQFAQWTCPRCRRTLTSNGRGVHVRTHTVKRRVVRVVEHVECEIAGCTKNAEDMRDNGTIVCFLHLPAGPARQNPMLGRKRTPDA